MGKEKAERSKQGKRPGMREENVADRTGQSIQEEVRSLPSEEKRNKRKGSRGKKEAEGEEESARIKERKNTRHWGERN